MFCLHKYCARGVRSRYGVFGRSGWAESSRSKIDPWSILHDVHMPLRLCVQKWADGVYVRCAHAGKRACAHLERSLPERKQLGSLRRSAVQCIRPTRAPARSRLPGLSPTDQGRMPRRTKVCAGHASLALPYQHYGLVEHVAQLRLQAVGDVVYHLGYLGLGLGHVGHELVEYGEG